MARHARERLVHLLIVLWAVASLTFLMFRLMPGDPTLNFCKLAEGMGVAASRATTAEAFSDQFGDAVKQQGPRLIEVVL